MQKNFCKKSEKMETRIPKIGIFDSGIGGLTVLRDCFFRLPEAEYYYFGDNAHAPYGNREEGEIVGFVEHALTTFAALGVDAAVLACNTATTVCIGQMREKFPFPILGTEPAVRLAAKECKHAIVLATVRTAESERLKELIASCPACKFEVLPCPNLAGDIEKAVTEGGKKGIGQLVPPPPISGEKPDGVVLGCTHYLFIKRKIEAFYGCKSYDGNRGVAEMLVRRLKIGRTIHADFEEKPNVCFEKKMKQMAKKRVFFLEKSQNTNKKVFFSNICFNQS